MVYPSLDLADHRPAEVGYIRTFGDAIVTNNYEVFPDLEELKRLA